MYGFKYRFFRFFKINKTNRTCICAPIAGVFLVLSLAVFIFSPLFAETISHTWGTLDTSTVAFDDNVFESDGSSLRLKAQNYANDINTSALYHFDELSGSLATDSSVNGNSANFNGGAAFSVGNLNNSMDLSSNGSFASTPDSESLTLDGQHTIEAWVRFNNQFSTSASQDQGVIDKGSYKVYYDRTSGKINYEIADGNSNTWTRQAGLDLKGSWDQDGKTIVRTSAVYGTDRYVGLGLGTGDAEVWRWNGTVWSVVGGDNINSSWADLVYEDVNDLVVNGDTLYAGLGTNAAGDAEVWSCSLLSNCSDWTKIGGDGINTGWQINTFESVNDMSFMAVIYMPRLEIAPMMPKFGVGTELLGLKSVVIVYLAAGRQIMKQYDIL
jgi:hypothetical protein